MNDIICSAPGKLFLSGEYAVLDGADAVITAVSRRARATLAKPSTRGERVIDSVRRIFAERVAEHLAAGASPPHVSAESPEFQIRRQKIGLGSSAAVAAAACGVLYEWAGLAIDENRDGILETAMTAHRAAQQGRGSGADVAAAVLGGAFVFKREGGVEPVDLGGVELIPVWSGQSASTSELLAKIEAFAARDPGTHRARFAELGEAAKTLAGAFRAGTPAAIIESTTSYGERMAALGRDSGAPIVTPQLDLIANLARDLGGAAKPSGAGGGDAAIAVFPRGGPVEEFKKHCLRHELVSLDITLGEPGLRRESAPTLA